MAEQTDDGLPVFNKPPVQTVDGLPILKKKISEQGSQNGAPSSNSGLNPSLVSLTNIPPQSLNYSPVQDAQQRQQLVQEDKRAQRKQSIQKSLQEDKGSATKYVVNAPLAGIGKLTSGIQDLMANVFSFIPAPNGQTFEETIGKVREDNNALRDAPEKVLGFEISDSNRDKYSKQFLTSALRGLGETLPALMTPKGLGLYVQAYDSGIQQINSTPEGKKLPEWGKTIYGGTVGTVQGALEKVGLNKVIKTPKLLNNVTNKIINKVFGKIAKEGAEKVTQEAVEELVDREVSTLASKARSIGAKALSGFATETATGGLQETAQVLTEIATNQATGKEIFDVDSFGNTAGRIARAAVQEGIGGGIMGGTVGALQRTQSTIRDKVAQATTPEEMQAVNEDIADVIANDPDITPEDKEALAQKAEQYLKVAETIPNTVTPEQKSEVMEHIVNRNEVDEAIAEKEQEMETVDEAFKVQVKNEIDALTEQRKDIDNDIQEVLKRDTKIEPQKDVKVNIKLAVEEIATNRKDDPKQIEVLFNQFKGKKPYSYDEGVPDSEIDEYFKNVINEDDIAPQIKGAFKKLYDKGYIDSIDDNYFVTKEGKEYIDAIQGRLDTRKGVKSGTDMFPADAGIEQAKEKPIINEPAATDTKIEETMPEQTIQESPAEPTAEVSETVVEPAKNITEEPNTTKARNLTTDEITKKYDLEIKLNDGKRSREVVESEADKKLSEGYDVNELIEKIRNDKHEASDTETVILAKHLGAQDAKVQEINTRIEKEGATMPDKTFNELADEKNRLLSDLEETATALKETGRATARGLGARRFAVQNDWSLATMIERKMREGNQGEKLTPEQLKDVEKQYTDLKKKNEDYQKKLEDLTAENTRLKAGENVDKLKREAALEQRRAKRTETKEKLDKEIEDTFADLKKKLKAQRGTLSANPIPVEYFPDIAKLVKLYAKKGITSVEGIIDEIHNNLVDEFEGLTKEHVLEAISDISEPVGTKDPLAATKSRIRNNIIKFKSKTAKGDFTRPKRTPYKLDKEALELRDELWKAKYEWELGLERDRLAKRTKGEKALDVATEIINVPRALLASTDLSAPLRQGLVQTISHPIIASKAVVHMLKSAVSNKAFDRWFYDLKESPDYQQMKDSKLYIADPHKADLTAKEEQFMTNIAQKIPVIGKIVGGSERAYIGYLNKLRVDIYRDAANMLESNGKTFENNPELYKGLAKWVNNSTGRGNMFNENAAQPASLIFFSPRLMASRINLLNPVWYAKLPPEIRRKALGDMAKFVVVGLTVLALAKLNGAEVEEDPRSSDFGKIKVGNTRWDIWGGFTQYARYISQMMPAIIAEKLTGKKTSDNPLAGQTKTTSTGEIKNLGEGKNPYDKTRKDITEIFFRNKLAPIPALLVNAMATKNSIGEDFDLQSDAIKSVIPLVTQDIYKAYNSRGIKGAAEVGIPAALGVGVQTYDDGQKVKEAKPSDKLEYRDTKYKLNEEQLAERQKINDEILNEKGKNRLEKWTAEFTKDAEKSKEYRDAIRYTVPKWRSTGKTKEYIKKQLETIKQNYIITHIQKRLDKYSADSLIKKYRNPKDKSLDLELAEQ